ncbi:MAG: hypothetical protein ABI639_14460 [Thermoanaerobaculia bacterium]
MGWPRLLWYTVRSAPAAFHRRFLCRHSRLRMLGTYTHLCVRCGSTWSSSTENASFLERD